MPRLTLAGLVLAIVGIGSVLYLGLGAYTWYRIDGLRGALHAEQQARARDEIGAALDALLEDGRTRVRELARWEETRLQLALPEYYEYWQQERLATRALPGYSVAVELYDAQGRVLLPPAQTPLETDLRHRDARPVLARERGRDYVLLVEPVADPLAAAGQPAPLGYVVLALDLARALVPPGGLRYAALDGAVSTLPDGARIPSSDLSNKIRYRVREPGAERVVAAMGAEFAVQAAVVTGAFMLLLYAVFSHFLGAPLRRLAEHVEVLKEQRDTAGAGLSEIFAVAELDTVRRSVNDYQSRLEVVNRGLDRKSRRLWKLAHHDSLTGSLNRRAFEDDWRALLAMAAEQPVDVSLILIDCMHFKAINDSYGHNTGDEVLRGVASTVQKNLYAGDRLYRIASDEFAVIFVDAGRLHAEQVARQCQSAIAKHGFTQLNIQEPVRISVAVAHGSGTGEEDLKGLYRRANVAMFHAKRPGNPRLVVYSPEMESSADAALSSQAASVVDAAIRTGTNLLMYYQPVVRLPARETEYYESLVRIRDGSRVLEPEQFFLQIETRHLDAEFDWAVLGALLADLEAGVLPPGSGVSINVSGASIVAPDVEERLQPFTRFFDRYKLLLEVTETTLITQLQLASETLRRLRAAGFLVALDDFGSGYSSLRYLADMPVDVVKFDISLVRAMCERSPRGEMLKQLVALLRGPGYKLVAEGVESEAIAATVCELGFHYGQGYMLGRPAPLRKAEA